MPELLIILAVLVLLFGAKKLPELGDSLGKGLRAFKKATEHGFAGDDKDDDKGVASNAQQGKLGTPTKAPASADAEKANQKSAPPG
jgi:sec-independent protein translocase protein TatA